MILEKKIGQEDGSPDSRSITLRMMDSHVGKEEAVTALRRCGHTLAKGIDGYNYAKFTMKSEEV